MDPNINPDELRDEADRLARRGSGADAHIVRAAADAWEAAEIYRISAEQWCEVAMALQKRLEAAEKRAKRLKKWLQHLDRCTSLDGWKCNCGLDAALAGEEK